MSKPNFEISLAFILNFTADEVALALGGIGHEHAQRRSISYFCGSSHGACTLSAADAKELVVAVDRLIRPNLGPSAREVDEGMVSGFVALFRLLYDAIERCVDLNEKNCVCSWERRIGDAERLTDFLIAVARFYWSTGAERDWMFNELEDLASHVNAVSERYGSIARLADDDQSIEARADRLSMRLFDAANDLVCDNWADDPWMWITPGR